MTTAPGPAPVTTETVDSRFAAVDRLPTLALASLINREDTTVAEAVGERLEPISTTVDAVVARLRNGGRLIYAGAGTAGRLGVLDASECPPTFNTDPELVVGLIAGGRDALVTAVEGAEDDLALARADVTELRVGPDDALIGISASGRTPYAVEAVTAASEVGAFTAGLSCNADTALSAAAEVPIEVVVGPEVVAGSTRLKAGTAQKLVLNMISTMTMVRLGKTYGNLMVDVRASNTKLVARVHRIVADATGADDETVDRAVRESGGRAKTAILAIITGLDSTTADAELAADDGVLRATLTRLTGTKE